MSEDEKKEQSFRDRLVNQPRWGSSNAATLELSDWVVGQKLIQPEGTDPEVVEILTAFRDQEEYCTMRISPDFNVSDRLKIKTEVERIAKKHGIHYRVVPRLPLRPKDSLYDRFPENLLDVTAISFEVIDKPKA
jgi:hypothetical protein